MIRVNTRSKLRTDLRRDILGPRSEPDAPVDEGVTYASWATTGSEIATGGFSYITELNDTDIAVIDTSANTLKTLRWGGSSFSVVGNSLAITLDGQDGISKLLTTRIALFDSLNNEIRAYDFDGTDWTSTGNALAVTIGDYTRGSYLADNEIAVHIQGSGLIKYTFDGTDFSSVGNIFSLTGDFFTLAAMTSSRVAVVRSANPDSVVAYDFDGTDWVAVGNSFSITLPTIAGSYGTTALSSTQILYYDSNTAVQTLIFDGTDWTKEGSSSALTGLGSWPRSLVKMSNTLVAYHSFNDADIRAAVATLA